MPPARIRERGRAKKGTMKKLLSRLFKLFPGKLILTIVCLVMNVLTNLCSSIFASLVTSALTSGVAQGLNPFVDIYEVKSPFGFTLWTNISRLLIILGCVYVVGVFTIWIWNRTMAVVTQEFLNKFRKEMFSHMQDLPIKYFDTHAHGAIMSLYTNDIDTIRQFISQALPMLVQTGLTVLFVFTMMIISSMWMAMVVVAGFFIMVIITKTIGGKSSRYFIKQQGALAQVEGNIEEAINGLKVIKVFSHEEKSAE